MKFKATLKDGDSVTVEGLHADLRDGSLTVFGLATDGETYTVKAAWAPGEWASIRTEE